MPGIPLGIPRTTTTKSTTTSHGVCRWLWWCGYGSALRLVFAQPVADSSFGVSPFSLLPTGQEDEMRVGDDAPAINNWIQVTDATHPPLPDPFRRRALYLLNRLMQSDRRTACCRICLCWGRRNVLASCSVQIGKGDMARNEKVEDRGWLCVCVRRRSRRRKGSFDQGIRWARMCWSRSIPRCLRHFLGNRLRCGCVTITEYIAATRKEPHLNVRRRRMGAKWAWDVCLIQLAMKWLVFDLWYGFVVRLLCSICRLIWTWKVPGEVFVCVFFTLYFCCGGQLKYKWWQSKRNHLATMNKRGIAMLRVLWITNPQNNEANPMCKHKIRERVTDEL